MARFKKLACLRHIFQNNLTQRGRVCTPCLSESPVIYDQTINIFLNFQNNRNLLQAQPQDYFTFEHDKFFFKFFCVSRSVVPNQGAAAHQGAVSQCQGCRQMLNLLDLYTYQTIQGCSQTSSSLSKGASNQKRLENTARITFKTCSNKNITLTYLATECVTNLDKVYLVKLG